MKVSVLCERGLLTLSGFSLADGVLMGHLGQSLAVKLIMTLLCSGIVFTAFRLFNGMLAVTAKGVELSRCCNRLRVELPKNNEWIASGDLERLIAYVGAINGGQGPGYTIFGVLITPRLVWGACVTLISTAGVSLLSAL